MARGSDYERGKLDGLRAAADIVARLEAVVSARLERVPVVSIKAAARGAERAKARSTRKTREALQSRNGALRAASGRLATAIRQAERLSRADIAEELERAGLV